MKTHLYISSAMALALSANGYAAETEEAKKESRLEKVTVSATFTEKKELETVTSVSIVGSDEIERQQANNVMELIATLPGVDINGGPNRQGAEFNIRGVTKPEQNIVRVDGVTKFFEGYRLGSFFGDPELLKQVDVVRGPVSTLYGSGAIGGVVNMTTKDAADFLKPGQTFGAKMKTGFSTVNDEWNGSLYLYARPEENIDLLGAVTFRDSDDYTLAGGDVFAGSAVNAKNALLKATVVLADYHTFGLSYQYSEDSGIVEYRQNDRGSAGNGFSEGLVDRALEDTNMSARYAFKNEENPLVDLELRFGYSKTYNQETGLDPAQVEGAVSSSLAPGEIRTFTYESWQVSAINTSRFNTGENLSHTLTAGVDYYKQDRSGDNKQGSPAWYYSTHPNGQQSVSGLFLQDEINIAERVILTPAIRYATYSTEGDAIGWESEIADVSNPVSASWFGKAETYSAWTPSVTAELILTKDVSLIGGYYKGFRAPAIDEIYSHSYTSAGKSTSLQLSEEKAETYEGGVKYATENIFSEGDILRLKLVYFHNDISDVIASIRGIPASVDPISYINSGEDQFKGWELEGLYDNGTSYLRTSFSSSRGRNITADSDLTSTPADQLAFSGGTRIAALELELGFQSQFIWRHHTVDPTVGGYEPGYNVHSLYLAWLPSAFDGLEARVSIDNLFDKDYKRHNSGIRAFGRDFRFTVAYKF